MEKGPNNPPGFTPKGISSAETQVGHSPHVESNKGRFDGMHDYLSNIRILDFIHGKGGIAGLFKYIHDEGHKIETLVEYIKRAHRDNKNLASKLDKDISEHPEIVEDLELRVDRINEAQNEQDLYYAFQDLKDFFK